MASGRSPSGWTQAALCRSRTRCPRSGGTASRSGRRQCVGRVVGTVRSTALRATVRCGDRIRADGFHVGPNTAYYWQLTWRAIASSSQSAFADFVAHFLPDGRAPRAGELFKRPDLARTLEQIAQSRGEAFYRGELAQRIARAAAAAGGAMTQADLAAHRADWVTPIRQAYRGIELLRFRRMARALPHRLRSRSCRTSICLRSGPTTNAASICRSKR